MPSTALHHSHGADFSRFLYAYVGADANGSVVTVLSTLARLGLDPWQEASELGALSNVAASARLSSILSRFQDVPALNLNHESVAQEISMLLPGHRALFRTFGPSCLDTCWIKGL
jgi:hypothetical protein